MAADFNKPVTTDAYATLLAGLRDLYAALAVGLDPAHVTPSNVPTEGIRWNSASSKWEKYDSSIWGDLAATYAISISGSAASLSATLPVNKGGTNLTSYTAGDLIYASGTTTLAKLAAVATGNVLISGGVGSAFAWGKVGLTTHVTGTLALGNGGTGATTAAGARTALGLGTAATKNTGTGVGDVLEFAVAGQLPALDGSQLTGITSIPSGMTMLWPGSTPPAGFLECDFAEVSRTTYAGIFAVIGTSAGPGNGSTTFNLPDMRGEIPRGWDHGRGVDSGRGLMTAQGGAIESHTHTGSTASGGSHSHTVTGYNTEDITGAVGVKVTTTGSGSNNRSTSTDGSHSHTLSINSTGGSETRMRNVAWMFVIKI